MGLGDHFHAATETENIKEARMLSPRRKDLAEVQAPGGYCLYLLCGIMVFTTELHS